MQVNTLQSDVRFIFYLLIYTNMKQKLSGFTLIELLIVIVIIAILATISVTTFTGYIERARDTKRSAAVATMASMMKIDGAEAGVDRYTEWSTDVLMQGLFDEHDFIPPTDGGQDICYFIVVSPGTSATTGADNEFAVLTWGEQTSTSDASAAGVIIDGTGGLVSNMLDNQTSLVEGDFDCDTAQTATSNLTVALAAETAASAGEYVFRIDEDGTVNRDVNN